MKFREIKINEELITRIALALKKSEITNGEYVEFVEQKMAEISNTAFAIAMSSGTMALKIALDAMGIKQGDKVIVPDITFVACANVVIELGAEPVFVDVNPNTYLMDLEAVRRLTQNGDIRAVMAVRLAGEQLEELEGLGVPVLVDSAHSMDPLPLHANAVIYSFHPSKIISGIEGGCLCTNDPEIARKAQILRNFGFGPGTRVITDQMVGYKANMTNVSAAMITTNLFNLNVILRRREYVRDQFNKAFSLNKTGLGMYIVTVKDPDGVCQKLPAIRHYPKTLSEMYFGEVKNEKAKWVSEHLVSIPFHEHMTVGDIADVCDIIKPELIKFNE